MRSLCGIILVPLLFLSGCSSWFWGDDSEPEPIEQQSPTEPAQETALDAGPAFNVVVEDEFFDGRSLYVRSTLNSSSAWALDDLAVSLRAYKDGNVVASRVAALKDLLIFKSAGTVSSDQPLKFAIKLAVSELSDYQLELLWGEDARHALNSTVRKGRLEIVDLTLDSCTENFCPEGNLVAGVLKNAGDADITDISLKVGFIWVKSGAELDQNSAIPQNARTVSLKSLTLKPGAEKPFKFRIKGRIPHSQGGRYEPIVRAIDNS